MSTFVRQERRRRGVFGVIFKYAFILYNLAMAWWLISYWIKVAPLLNNAVDEATRTGGTVGAALGTATIAGFWVAGTVVLGLFTLLTRGKTVTIHERIRPDPDQ